MYAKGYPQHFTEYPNILKIRPHSQKKKKKFKICMVSNCSKLAHFSQDATSIYPSASVSHVMMLFSSK